MQDCTAIIVSESCSWFIIVRMHAFPSSVHIHAAHSVVHSGGCCVPHLASRSAHWAGIVNGGMHSRTVCPEEESCSSVHSQLPPQSVWSLQSVAGHAQKSPGSPP